MGTIASSDVAGRPESLTRGDDTPHWDFASRADGHRDRGKRMQPIVLFGIQFTFSLVAYALLTWWYLVPRLARLPREVALVPLLWIHVFRIVGGTILAPGAVDAAVPAEFRTMIGFGDIATALLALIALIALRVRWRGAIALVWVVLAVGLLDTVNAIIQSMRFSVFTHA